MKEKQVKDYDKFMLRFPDGMRDAVADRAKKNGRSMNSEIVQILQDALDLDKQVSDPDLFVDYRELEGGMPLPESLKKAARKLITSLEEFELLKTELLKQVSTDNTPNKKPT
ncbi:TPA: Arc family DNA-binding protein [Serratia marcescens]|uniref:Arc family DNA-binding protein n=1 Tax=Serratia nevei TaxID=2703794 RepID=UPI002AB54B5D|nr:Arc family DNA-binding protein [Serratia marcescens]